MLRDRLFHAQGGSAAGPQPPTSFNRASTVKPAPAAQASAPKAQVMVGNHCFVLRHSIRRLQTKVCCLWFSGSVPASCSLPAAASSAVSLHSTGSSSHNQSRSTAWFSCGAAQCDPPWHEASVPPACTSCSWFEMLLTVFFFFFTTLL